MAHVIRFDLNEKLYLRDPQETALGRNILQQSINLIHEIGFEAFTFKKLAKIIASTEASIYRYFENKHTLLVYLVSWYWEWTHYLIDRNTLNILNPIEKLTIALQQIVDASIENATIDYINEEKLHHIVIDEGAKAYHTKSIDQENNSGYFLSYKLLAEKLTAIILEIKPNFLYPRALASNLLEMHNNQVYFANHLPRLTDIKSNNKIQEQVYDMLTYFTFQLLHIEQEKNNLT